jgi:hypothetical protein
LTGTPDAGLIVVYPDIQIKAIKGNTLLSDANFNEIRPYLGIKAVSVHA